MNLPTEVRYRPYADWTDEEKQRLEKMSLNHLGVQVTISNQKQVYLMIQTVFLTLMVSSNSSTKVGHLELLMV